MKKFVLVKSYSVPIEIQFDLNVLLCIDLSNSGCLEMGCKKSLR